MVRRFPPHPGEGGEGGVGGVTVCNEREVQGSRVLACDRPKGHPGECSEAEAVDGGKTRHVKLKRTHV